MANAVKCDRCGRFYDNYNMRNNEDNINGIMTLNIDMNRKYFSHRAIDLCPECMKSFKQWLGGK